MSESITAPEEAFEVGRPRLTALGLVLVWSVVAVLALGVWRYDGALIWFSGVGLLVLGVARFWAPWNLEGIGVARKRPEKVFAGEMFVSRYRIEQVAVGRRWIPRVGLSLVVRDLSLRPEVGTVRFGRGLAVGEVAEGSLRVRCFRRGRDRRTEAELRSGFPLGIFETRARGKVRDEAVEAGEGIMVFPQPWLPPGLRRDLESFRFESSLPIGSELDPGLEFRGIRQYRSGDPVKAVHWPATARAREMMVREWDPPVPRPQRFGVILHTVERGRRMLRPDRWEMVLRLVTGLLAHGRSQGIPVHFFDLTAASGVVRFQVPRAHSFPGAFRHLAEAERRSTESSEALRRAVGDLGRDCDRLYVVSDVPVDRWRAEVAAAGEGLSLVCVDPDSVIPVRRRPRLSRGRNSQTRSEEVVA